jgi:hypothetical protein
MTINGNKFMRSAILIFWFSLTALLHSQQHPDLGNVTDYPVDSRVWLGSLVGQIIVNPEFPIEVSTLGRFEWKVEDGERVEEGAVVGLAGADKINLSQLDLEIKKVRYDNSLVDLELSNAEKRHALAKAIEDMEAKISKMSLTEGERGLLGEGFAKKLALERETLEVEIKRAQERLVGNYFDLAENAGRRALDLEIERAEHEIRELLRSSEILAPAAGRLAIDVRENLRKAGVVGRIVRDGVAEAQLEISDYQMRHFSGKELVIEVSGEDGRPYTGKYARDLERRSMNDNAKIMVFEILKHKDQEAVPASVSGSRMIRIFKSLEKPGRILPKKDLLHRFPKEIDKEGWAAFVRKRWPGVEISYVGPRDIVVIPAP